MLIYRHNWATCVPRLRLESGVRITKFGYPERGQLTAHLLPNCQPIKHLHFKHISCLDQGPGCCPWPESLLHGSQDPERRECRCGVILWELGILQISSFLPAGSCCRGWVDTVELYSHISPSQQLCRMQPSHNIWWYTAPAFSLLCVDMWIIPQIHSSHCINVSSKTVK